MSEVVTVTVKDVEKVAKEESEDKCDAACPEVSEGTEDKAVDPEQVSTEKPKKKKNKKKKRDGPPAPYAGKKYPDRWLDYRPTGTHLGRFFPIKCPLDLSFFAESTPPNEIFDIHRFVGYLTQAKIVVGLVIDLTATTRYYDKNDWESYNIYYRKLICPGHEIDRREDIALAFQQLVNDYCAFDPRPYSLIVVHCTHGVNRTGYLICRYLIDQHGWTAQQAITEFEKSRGHGIDRENYKASLRRAYARQCRKWAPRQ